VLLTNTKRLMQHKLEQQAFDTYVVLVHANGEELMFTSDNADGDTLFDIASCGKILHTSPLILQAADEGRLSLNSTLADFFDNVPEDKKAITIKQLLTHSSGIVRIPLPKEICAQGIDATAAYIIANPLAYAPGSDYIYSCNGMILLGYILEKLYGKTLDVLFEERLKKPLGMTRSCFKIEVDEPNAAICYTRREVGPLRFDDANVLNMGRVGGSGGSFFSANDVHRFAKAVMEKNEVLFSRPFHDLAEVNYTPNYSEGRGLGYLVVDEKYPQTGNLFPIGSFGHCGHTGQSMFFNRKLDLYAVILTNATRFSAMKQNFVHDDYGTVMAMRAEIHNEIKRDLEAENLLKL